MKKLLCLILSFVLMSTMSCVTSFAEELPDEPNVLEYEQLENGDIKITKYDSLDAEFVIPSEIDGNTVTTIGKKAFYSCHALKKVTIPDTVTTIEDRAFDSCKKLTTVELGDNVTSPSATGLPTCGRATSMPCSPPMASSRSECRAQRP